MKPIIVACQHSKKSPACIGALARSRLAPLVIVHRQRRHGAEVILHPSSTTLLSAPVRHALVEQWGVWEITGWIAEGGVGITSPRLCRWHPVPRAVLDAFVADVVRLISEKPPAAPSREAGGHKGEHCEERHQNLPRPEP